MAVRLHILVDLMIFGELLFVVSTTRAQLYVVSTTRAQLYVVSTTNTVIFDHK